MYQTVKKDLILKDIPMLERSVFFQQTIMVHKKDIRQLLIQSHNLKKALM